MSDFEKRISKMIEQHKSMVLNNEHKKIDKEANKFIEEEEYYSEWDKCLHNVILPAINKTRNILEAHKINCGVSMPDSTGGQGAVRKYFKIALNINYKDKNYSLSFAHVHGTQNVRVTTIPNIRDTNQEVDERVKVMTPSRIDNLLEDFIDHIFPSK